MTIVTVTEKKKKKGKKNELLKRSVVSSKTNQKKKKPLPFNCKISIESLKNTHHNHTYHLQYPHKFTHLFTQFEKKKNRRKYRC